MDFRLLKPVADNDRVGQETARDLLRAKEAQDAEREWRLKNAKAEQDFNNTLAKQRTQWAHEEDVHHERVQQRKQEIDELEVKKLNMLVPFAILKEGTDDRFKEAETFLGDLRKRELHAVDLTALLEERLDEVGQREQDVKKREELADMKELGIQEQSRTMKLQNDALTQEMAEWRTKKSEEEAELDKKKTTLYLFDHSLQAKDEAMKRREKSLSELAIRLQDERSVLDQAWNELKSKKGFST